MRQMPQIAHVDVNCFYASAERAFNPSLEGRTVIVLSNNERLRRHPLPRGQSPRYPHG
ncbi:MAG: DNA-directed polymerase [Arthrobacter sp.]|jgi:DNA polymerase V|nr:DNA-directed polymerase [Arthrobacter sp.]